MIAGERGRRGRRHIDRAVDMPILSPARRQRNAELAVTSTTTEQWSSAANGALAAYVFDAKTARA